MTITWPTTPDTLPKPTSTTNENDSGFNHDELHTDNATLLERLEAVASGQLFINGAYEWWQRVEFGSQTCTTTFNAITSFGPDRMFTLPAGASVVVTKNGTVPSTRSIYSAQLTGAASVTTVDHGQRIRSSYYPLYQQSLIFSAYIRNETGASFTPLFRVDTPAAVDDWTTPTNRYSTSLQACANNAWTQVWIVFDPTAFTNSLNGISVHIRIPSGSMVAGDTVYVAEMSLRPGVALVPYLPLDLATERLRCLPYYRKSYARGTAPATDTTTGLVGSGALGSGASNVYTHVPFTPPMWKAPTIALYGKSGTANQFYILSAATNNNTAVVSLSSPDGFVLTNSTTSADQVFAHYTAVAELT